MISGIQKIAVYDTVTGTTVQLNNIVPEGNAKIRVPISVKGVDGLNYFDGEDSLFSFAAYDNEGFDQLYEWMEDGIKVQFAALGIDQHLLWIEPAYILVNKGYGFKPGSRNPFFITFAIKRGTHNIEQVANLVRSGGKWEDADADEEADCLTFTGSSTLDFDGERQHIDGGAMVADSTIKFPFSGVKVFAKMNQKAENPAQNWVFTLEARNFAGALLGSDSATDSDDVLELTLPVTTYSVRIKVAVSGVSNVKFYLPYLGLEKSSYLDINY